jgi:hypothetical protein
MMSEINIILYSVLMIVFGIIALILFDKYDDE